MFLEARRRELLILFKLSGVTGLLSGDHYISWHFPLLGSGSGIDIISLAAMSTVCTIIEVAKKTLRSEQASSPRVGEQ
jgi:hypothetical protein